MASRHSPAKVTLAMMKGKPIATSVPAIRYHASDDELEELYPSTDEEKQTTPESEKGSAKSSPCKSIKGKGEGADGEVFEKRSSSMDGSFSEGTPPTDPWKMFSDFRGKLTKTFEEKLSEIKSEKKSKRRSREDSSVSDYEDLGDVTPTEDFVPEKQEKEKSTASAIIRRRARSSRFAGFSNIKTGLKAKNCHQDSVESGIEAAELADEAASSSSAAVERDDDRHGKSFVEGKSRNSQTVNSVLAPNSSDQLSQLKRKLIYKIAMLPIVLCCSYYLLPLPEYVIGFLTGIFVILTVQKAFSIVKETLAAPLEKKHTEQPIVPFVEVPAAKEYAVVERFEGWLNELPYDYAHDNYHVARTNPVFFKLEGENLRIMETRTRVAKRAVWNEGQIVPKFTRKRVYSMRDAKVELLPDGLTRRRRWSKKYPICVTFGRKGVIESVDINSASEDETTKTDTEKERTILEEEENEREVRREKEQRDKEQEEDAAGDDAILMSQLNDTVKDVFTDCRDEGDNDDDDDEDASKLKIYVFARTDRQKEEWYRRLVRATTFGSKRNSITPMKDTTPSSSSPPTAPTSGDSKTSLAATVASEITCELSYNVYMSRYIDAQLSPTTESDVSLADNDVVWLNALLGRILFDMHKSSETINLIQEKIQRKLSNIKLPYFMESLLVSELVIGQGAPVIHKASKPVIDESGLSIDLDITYEGCLTMTIETKLNLMKLTRAGSVSSNSNDLVNADKPKPARSPMFDSDVEDSPETSTEEEDSTHLPCSSGSRESTPTQSSGRKFLSMVDKLAANRYFQHAAELSYVRRAMEGLSNTEIRLMVNVSSIKGCLTVNIPPPPSDRIWYGFKPVPSIILTAKPAVGEMAVNIGYVTKWIETKLLKEFERVVVLPNMDDLLISLCPNYPFHDA